MKYALMAILLTLITLLSSTNIYAAVDRQPKTVRGKVLLPNGAVAKNASVTITCKSNVLTDLTSNFGNYEVTYSNLECEQFDMVYISAVLNDLTGSAFKEAQYFNGVNVEDMTLLEPSPDEEIPTSVPEWGVIGGIVAAGSSLLSYVTIRRKT